MSAAGSDGDILRERVSTTRRDARALRGEVALRRELRAAAVSYARTLRSLHVEPQRMLVLVKTAADVSESALPPAQQASIVGDVVRWSIDAYYDGAP
jgi:hypothetical protein